MDLRGGGGWPTTPTFSPGDGGLLCVVIRGIFPRRTEASMYFQADPTRLCVQARLHRGRPEIHGSELRDPLSSDSARGKGQEGGGRGES